MKKLIVAIALVYAPALAYAEGLTIITGDDDFMQIMTSDDNGTHWKTLQRIDDNFYMEYDGSTGERRPIFDFRDRPQPRNDEERDH